MSVAVGVAQFAPAADTARNVGEIGELAAVAAERGARVVVFPEYSSYFIDPFDASLHDHAEPVDGPFTAALRDIAAAEGVTIVAGLLEAGDGDRVRNTVVAVDETGVVASYRKLHLYDAFGWSRARSPSRRSSPSTDSASES